MKRTVTISRVEYATTKTEEIEKEICKQCYGNETCEIKGGKGFCFTKFNQIRKLSREGGLK